MIELTDKFSQDFMILSIVTSELKLATLYELQTQYSVSDMYDIIEMIDAHTTMVEYQRRQEELERKNNPR
jgi:hypothetical protein